MAGIVEFLRWLEAHGITSDQLPVYRECAEQILREAGGSPAEPEHVEAARRALESAGARRQTLAQLRNVGDALRRFQRDAAVATRAERPPATVSKQRTPLPVAAFGAALVIVGGLVVGGFSLFPEIGGEEPQHVQLTPGTDAASVEPAEVREAHAEFESSMLAGDLARLRGIAADEQLAELVAPDAAQKMELAKALYPQNATSEQVTVTGDAALITAHAPMMDQIGTGRIELVGQGGRWKIRKADWKVSFREQPEPFASAAKRDVARPADFPQLVGTWKGRETHGETDWTLTFADGYRLSARSSSGDFYEGEVMIRWDLGIENDRIHMPPGWGPIDTEIDQASWPQAIGRVALGAFSLSQGELKLCGGQPGLGTRVKSFEAPGPEYRCMVLTKALGEVAVAPAENADTLDADFSAGEATLLLDGVAQRYALQTDFLSDTVWPSRKKRPCTSSCRRPNSETPSGSCSPSMPRRLEATTLTANPSTT